MAPPKPSTSSTIRTLQPSILADGLVFAGTTAIALLVFWALYSFLGPSSTSHSIPNPSFFPLPTAASLQEDLPTSPSPPCNNTDGLHDSYHESTSPTFYDDPKVTYTIHEPITNWDEKRKEWLHLHPSFLHSNKVHERVLMVTGSEATPCKNPIGDHLLLRFFKNKVDYCRLHNIPIFYNTVLLEPIMFTYWAKTPTIRAAMLAHPEADWIWWVDCDAVLTDMEFELPLHRYSNHNMVVHGWPESVKGKSWTGLNAGVFLIRNCQWSLDFMDVWAGFGPQTPDFEKWGKILQAEFPNKNLPESDDQSALVYLILHEKEKWGNKIYLEYEYYFEGYWLEIVGRLENMTERYLEMERQLPELRRRRAEVVGRTYGRMRERKLVEEGWKAGYGGWRRPFITHFTGCQPCSGNHNKMYSGESCYEGMQRALNFADDQVLRNYGFRHCPGLLNTSEVCSLPFDFPATAAT